MKSRYKYLFTLTYLQSCFYVIQFRKLKHNSNSSLLFLFMDQNNL